MGRALAKLLGADRISQASNEVVWQGKRAVIKSCRPGTSSFGVTSTMLPRLQSILAGFEDERGEVQVWELDAGKFKAAMYDSRSASAVGGKVKLVTRSYARTEGRAVGRFTKAEIQAAT